MSAVRKPKQSWNVLPRVYHVDFDDQIMMADALFLPCLEAALNQLTFQKRIELTMRSLEITIYEDEREEIVTSVSICGFKTIK